MKALVLHSGGLDSTVCVLKALEIGRDVVSLGIDYGQRHRIEMEYAKVQCERFGVERRQLRVEWDKPFRDIPVGRSMDVIRSAVSPTFLPGRNAVFLTLACAEAAGIGASEVWIGVNEVDFSGYPDCRPEFIAAFAQMISLAIPNGPIIVSPLSGMSKPDIALEARRLGLERGDTWSCYQPRIDSDGIAPCHECDACLLHDYAWTGQKNSVEGG
jgi:7-cyano-7-deazaguanine synthase